MYEKEAGISSMGWMEIQETYIAYIVGSTEAPSKVFLLFFLCSDWLKSNHLRSRIGRDFLDIFRVIFVALQQKQHK